MRALFLVFILFASSGQGAAYGFDEITGGLTLSHKYTLPVKDYPGE